MPQHRANAAIGADQRKIVAKCLKHVLHDPSHVEVLLLNERETVEQLADRLGQPGPPLVSTADVIELLDLIRSLLQMQEGEALDHQWGDGRRVSGDKWEIDDVLVLAQRMYEDHLFWRGLTPAP